MAFPFQAIKSCPSFCTGTGPFQPWCHLSQPRPRSPMSIPTSCLKCEGGGFPSLHTSGKHWCERHTSFSLTHRNQKSEIKPHTSQHTVPALYPHPSLLFWPPKTLLMPILLPRMLCPQPTLLKTATSLSLWSFPRYPHMPPCFQSGPHPSVVHLTARRLMQDLRWFFHFWQDGETVSTLPLLLNAAPHAGQRQQAALESSEKSAVEGRWGKRAIQGSPIQQWVCVFLFQLKYMYFICIYLVVPGLSYGM